METEILINNVNLSQRIEGIEREFEAVRVMCEWLDTGNKMLANEKRRAGVTKIYAVELAERLIECAKSLKTLGLELIPTDTTN